MKKLPNALLLLFFCLNVNAQRHIKSLTAIDSTFYKNLSSKIKYPPIAIENEHHGKLEAVFLIDETRKVKYIRIVTSPDELISASVIEVLKRIIYPKGIQSNQLYLLPINFAIIYAEFRYSGQTRIAIPAPDSIQAKLAPPISLISGLIYNPNDMPKPTTQPVSLKELSKSGYKSVLLKISIGDSEIIRY